MINEFRTRIITNKEETDKLEERLRELEEKEQTLIEKLKQTYTLHKKKYDEFQKVFQAKVDLNTPIDLNILRSSEQNQHQERQTNSNDCSKGKHIVSE